MRKIALTCAAAAAVLILLALYGRFTGQPTITVGTHSFQAQTLVMFANTGMLLGVFLLLWTIPQKR